MGVDSHNSDKIKPKCASSGLSFLIRSMALSPQKKYQVKRSLADPRSVSGSRIAEISFYANRPSVYPTQLRIAKDNFITFRELNTTVFCGNIKID